MPRNVQLSCRSHLRRTRAALPLSTQSDKHQPVHAARRQVLLTQRYRQGTLTLMGDLDATREILKQQLRDAIATDPVAALSTIAELQRDADEYLREAVRQAATSSSWSEIAKQLSVSKQAAHQRFKAYAKDATRQMKNEHRAMQRARRAGDADVAAKARAPRDDLAAELKASAKALAGKR